VRVRIKICGLTRPEDVAAAVGAGADAIGFVHVVSSPRFVDPSTSRRLAVCVPPFVSRVGLFVNAAVEVIEEAVSAVGLDTVQFHGEETPDMCARFKGRLRVLKAFRIRGPESLKELEPYRDVSDGWLLDAHVPGVHGGTGARFDWSLAAAACALGHPVILAGGLTPENAGEAVVRVKPYALDVSSGVESAPGIKDAGRIEAFMNAAWGRSVP